MNRRILRTLAAIGTASLVGLTSAACGSGSGSGSGSGDGARTVNLGHPFPEGSVTDQVAEDFAARVDEATEGEIKFEVLADSQLGSDEELGTALTDGTMDAALFNHAASGVDERLQIHYTPFLVDTEEQADELFFGSGYIADYEKKVLEERGIVALEFVENGFRALSTNGKEVRVPADIEGMKIRTPGTPFYFEIFKQWGASPASVDVSELYTALEQGVVDGQENGLTIFTSMNLKEVQDTYTQLNHLYGIASLSVSKNFWDSLDEETQQILTDSAEAASLEGREAQREKDETDLATLKDEITVIELTPAELDEWRSQVQPALSLMEDIIGADTLAELQAEAARIRGEE